MYSVCIWSYTENGFIRNPNKLNILFDFCIFYTQWLIKKIDIDSQFQRTIKYMYYLVGVLSIMRMFVLLLGVFVHSRTLQSFSDITIAGEGLQILTYARQ